MSIRIDDEARAVWLSVRDLAGVDAPAGSISAEGMPAARAALGREVHEAHQHSRASTHKTFRSEHTLKHSFPFDGWTVHVHGRIDGLYRHRGRSIVEEVKSVRSLERAVERLDGDVYGAWLLQLRLYVLFLARETGRAADGVLILIEVRTGESRRLPVEVNEAELDAIIGARVRTIIEEHEALTAWRERLAELADNVPFPFAAMRPHQDEMVRRIEEALESRSHLLVSAPTGIGKTAGALWPVVRFAMRRGLRVFFLTSKTTQQRLVIETLQRMQPAEDGFVALHLRAREKMCPNDVYFCHPEFCRYARGYGERLAGSTAIADLTARGVITPEDCYDVATAETLCPFELALDVSLKADVIVCDYNYVFDPAVYLRRFFDERRSDDTVLVIDEAHNLYARGREYYSPELHRASLREVADAAHQSGAPVMARLAEWCEAVDQKLVEIAGEVGEENERPPKYLVEPDAAFFSGQQTLLDDILVEYAEHCRANATLGPNDPVWELYYAFRALTNVLELGGEEFSAIWDGAAGGVTSGGRLKVLCKDPSRQLGERLDGCYAALGMSATLVPLTFYRDVLGFDRDRTRLVALPSPFPKEHRRVLVVGDVSTRYRHRSQSLERVARVIEQVAAARRGNTIVFFPSFEYLEAVAAHVVPASAVVLRQERFMSERARGELLDRLRQERGNHVVLAVQGGIFAEGVDYPGGMLIGVIVVGPGLPRVSFEQELMREYYAERYEMGFEYAYLYVGMNRVIQSVGRLIRSEHDAGVAVLIGQRFTTPPYAELMPPDWYEGSPLELVTYDVAGDVARFWEEIAAEEALRRDEA
ncbi:MAG: PD-(D/E)XK nuclease family protein [Verrucomicrobia bacterium]|nr:PD-(D/E)XK nuclease family protein [Verrucomicrobiota bacterium]